MKPPFQQEEEEEEEQVEEAEMGDELVCSVLQRRRRSR